MARWGGVGTERMDGTVEQLDGTTERLDGTAERHLLALRRTVTPQSRDNEERSRGVEKFWVNQLDRVQAHTDAWHSKRVR